MRAAALPSTPSLASNPPSVRVSCVQSISPQDTVMGETGAIPALPQLHPESRSQIKERRGRPKSQETQVQQGGTQEQAAGSGAPTAALDRKESGKALGYAIDGESKRSQQESVTAL